MHQKSAEPPRFVILKTREEKVPFLEALRISKESGMELLTLAQSYFFASSNPEEYRSSNPLWTKTMLAYMQPDRPLGETITCEGRTLHIPHQYKGKKNLVLIAEDYMIDSKGGFWSETIRAIANFPRQSGYYLLDEETGLPAGDPISQEDPNSVHLGRYIPPFFGSAVQGCLCGKPGDGLGAVVVYAGEKLQDTALRD